MITIKLMLFVVCTMLILWVSRKPLRNPGSHGFYRTLAWEVILLLILLNLHVWFKEPMRLNQIISWVLLSASLVFVYLGFRLLKLIGAPNQDREDPSLIGLEKTTELISVGAYAYIRHPLYSSLLFLTWGVFFKRLSWAGVCLAVVASVLLTVTARIEEKENLTYFGEAYQDYMQRTKMFIPYVF